MRKKATPLIIGIATILVTILLYFTIFNNVVLGAIHFISLVAIVLSEIIATAYAYGIGDSPRRLAAVVIVAAMVPVSIALSAIYILCFPLGYATYIALFVVGQIVVNALAFILLHVDWTRERDNNQLQDAKENMRMLRAVVKGIMSDPAAKPYAGRLRALEEELHFSNDAVILQEDADIHQQLLELRDNIAVDGYDVEGKLAKIEKAVKMRKITASTTV